MQEWEGKKVFGGIAIGKIYVYQKGQQQVRRMTIQDPDAELARYQAAKEAAVAQLQELYEKEL